MFCVMCKFYYNITQYRPDVRPSSHPTHSVKSLEETETLTQPVAEPHHFDIHHVVPDSWGKGRCCL